MDPVEIWRLYWYDLKCKELNSSEMKNNANRALYHRCPQLWTKSFLDLFSLEPRWWMYLEGNITSTKNALSLLISILILILFICRTFPVRTFYLEDLLEHTNHFIEEGSRCALRSTTANSSKSILVRSRQGTEMHDYIASDEVSENFPTYSIETRK